MQKFQSRFELLHHNPSNVMRARRSFKQKLTKLTILEHTFVLVFFVTVLSHFVNLDNWARASGMNDETSYGITEDNSITTKDESTTSEEPSTTNENSETSEEPSTTDNESETSEEPSTTDNESATSEEPSTTDNESETSEEPSTTDNESETSEGPKTIEYYQSTEDPLVPIENKCSDLQETNYNLDGHTELSETTRFCCESEYFCTCTGEQPCNVDKCKEFTLSCHQFVLDNCSWTREEMLNICPRMGINLTLIGVIVVTIILSLIAVAVIVKLYWRMKKSRSNSSSSRNNHRKRKRSKSSRNFLGKTFARMH